MYKKILSVFLVISMLAVLSVSAFAVQASQVVAVDENAVVDLQEIWIGENLTNGYIMRIEDYENGDVRFSKIEQGVVIDTYYIDQENHTICETNHTTGISKTKNTLSTVKNARDAAMPVSIGKEQMGTIGYDLYSQGYVIDTKYIIIHYNENWCYGVSHDLNAKYKDMVEFAATVAGAFSLSGDVANRVAAAIIAALGYSDKFKDLIIPANNVICDERIITWTGTNSLISSQYSVVEGSKYYISLDGEEVITETSGSYYERSAFTSRNNQFGLLFAHKLYTGLLGGTFDDIVISSWSDK